MVLSCADELVARIIANNKAANEWLGLAAHVRQANIPIGVYLWDA